jgi:hypothetical protein
VLPRVSDVDPSLLDASGCWFRETGGWVCRPNEAAPRSYASSGRADPRARHRGQVALLGVAGELEAGAEEAAARGDEERSGETTAVRAVSLRSCPARRSTYPWGRRFITETRGTRTSRSSASPCRPGRETRRRRASKGSGRPRSDWAGGQVPESGRRDSNPRPTVLETAHC